MPLTELPFAGWVSEHMTAARALLFLSCAGWWCILYFWVQPSQRSVERASLAALMQLWLGTLADVAIVHQGFWTYRDLPLSLEGVPIDLHVDWALIWGFGICWLSDKILPGRSRPLHVAAYLAAWTLLTLAFDILMADSLLFLERAAPLWWVADTAFLLIVQGLTLWLYRSIGDAHPGDSTLAGLPAIPPFIRSSLYLSFALAFFFVWVPDQIEAVAGAHGLATHVWETDVPAWIVAAAAFPIGIWATWEFAARGQGTPIPFDPPHRLVTGGPYRWVRNPMQCSGVLLTLAVVLQRPSPLMALYLANVLAMVLVVFQLFEPGSLEQRFGEDWARYRGSVRNWWPGLPNRMR